MTSSAFFIIAIADALAPNVQPDLSLASADLSPLDYVKTKNKNYFYKYSKVRVRKSFQREDFFLIAGTSPGLNELTLNVDGLFYDGG